MHQYALSGPFNLYEPVEINIAFPVLNFLKNKGVAILGS